MWYACRLKNRNWVRATKTIAWETSLVVQKHRMSVCATRVCRRPKHKNNVFGRHGLSPVRQILSSKKTETEFRRHKFVARATTISPKNIETMFARRGLVAQETCLVARKCRNCVCATDAHKHCKFINRSTLANFGEKNKNYS